MPTQEQAERHAAAMLDFMRESMVESIGHRTVGNTDSATPIPSLFFFRREEPMPPCICMVEPASFSSSKAKSKCW